VLTVLELIDIFTRFVEKSKLQGKRTIIGGVTNFRLFLPFTTQHSNEFCWYSLEIVERERFRKIPFFIVTEINERPLSLSEGFYFSNEMQIYKNILSELPTDVENINRFDLYLQLISN